jgi:hypothetical protein
LPDDILKYVCSFLTPNENINIMSKLSNSKKILMDSSFSKNKLKIVFVNINGYNKLDHILQIIENMIV